MLLSNLLIFFFFFTEISILDAWWETKSISGSIYVCFFEFIDDISLTFFCSYLNDLINVEVVKKGYIYLILICTSCTSALEI